MPQPDRSQSHSCFWGSGCHYNPWWFFYHLLHLLHCQGCSQHHGSEAHSSARSLALCAHLRIITWLVRIACIFFSFTRSYSGSSYGRKNTSLSPCFSPPANISKTRSCQMPVKKEGGRRSWPWISLLLFSLSANLRHRLPLSTSLFLLPSLKLIGKENQKRNQSHSLMLGNKRRKGLTWNVSLT